MSRCVRSGGREYERGSRRAERREQREGDWSCAAAGCDAYAPLRLLLISYQDYHMSCLACRGETGPDFVPG